MTIKHNQNMTKQRIRNIHLKPNKFNITAKHKNINNKTNTSTQKTLTPYCHFFP